MCENECKLSIFHLWEDYLSRNLLFTQLAVVGCGDTWFQLILPRFYVLTSCVSCCEKTLLSTVYSNWSPHKRLNHNRTAHKRCFVIQNMRFCFRVDSSEYGKAFTIETQPTLRLFASNQWFFLKYIGNVYKMKYCVLVCFICKHLQVSYIPNFPL